MIRFAKWSEQWYKRPIHFCGWDRQCRHYGAPPYLYLHFLKDKDGHSVVVKLGKEKPDTYNWTPTKRQKD